VTNILEFNQVSLISENSYKLKNISFKVYEGDKIALLGKSGSGKTTIISLANGSLKATSGEIRFKGKNIANIKRNEITKISTLWQDLRLLEELNVQQNINIGALGRKNFIWSIRNLFGNIETPICNSYLQAVGLEESFLSSKINQISGGQKQRVAIARLLRQQAQLILADEPLVNLDPIIARNILNLLLDKSTNFKINLAKTIIISNHQPEFINDFSRVIGVNKGEIVLDMPTTNFTDLEYRLIYS
tara:strand:- start:15788 stop:16525 length:738 start_codon:yes stop_codon:yes gene_type:complete